MNYRYQNIKVTNNSQLGEQYYSNNVYPQIPTTEDDTYVIAVLGDRLDLMAFDFYGDPSFWWVIASANALPGDSLYLEPGSQVRIPAEIRSVINQYNSTNASS